MADHEPECRKKKGESPDFFFCRAAEKHQWQKTEEKSACGTDMRRRGTESRKNGKSDRPCQKIRQHRGDTKFHAEKLAAIGDGKGLEGQRHA